jgi:hypothetical protein
MHSPLAKILALGLLSCAALAAVAADLAPPRRVITAAAPGEGVTVVADGASSNITRLNGATITRLFETGTVPVTLPLPGDTGATAANAYRPGFAGTSLYTADLPPGIRIELHAQQSVDYIAVLAGQVDLTLPGGRRTLKTGDILVQAANLHGWENPYAEPARILVVVMSASPPPQPTRRGAALE